METTSKNSSIPTMIVLTFLGFFLFIGYMVYQSFQTDVNLVRDDYYEQSTLHDERLADINRSEKANIELYYDAEIEEVVLITPFESVDGEIQFYRPSDSKLDFSVPIDLVNKQQKLSTAAIQKGKWELKAVFTFKDDNYYKESYFNK